MNFTALEQLFANNHTSKQVSLDNKSYTFDDYGSVVIPIGVCDLFYPLFIISPYELGYLELLIGNVSILKFPLDFCNKLVGYKNENKDSFTYKIPWEHLKFMSIPLVRIKKELTHFKLYAKNDTLTENKVTPLKYSDIRLYICNIFIKNSQEIKNLPIKNDEIKLFNEKKVTISKYEEEIDISDFYGTIKGIFLDNIDFESIKSFKLYFGPFERISYGEDELLLLSNKIDDDCYYLSFDDTEYNTLNWDSSINISGILNTIDKIYLKINSTKIQEITLRALSFGSLTTSEGKAKVLI